MVSGPEEFRDVVVATLRELKQARDGASPRLIPIPRAGRPELVLRPVTMAPGAAGDRDVELFTAWRNRHRESFLTWFTATREGTRRWLHDVNDEEDRVLLMVEADGIAFGHLGVRSFDPRARRCEVDNVVRGRHDVLPGGMTLALRGLLAWLFGELHCAGAFLRVFADNRSALALYERCGFAVERTVPIEAVRERTGIRWVERTAPEAAPDVRRLAYMAVRADLTDERSSP